jgi:hypothetical protein
MKLLTNWRQRTMSKKHYIFIVGALIGATIGSFLGETIYYHYNRSGLGINEIQLYNKCLSLESTTHQQYTICSNGKSFYEAK